MYQEIKKSADLIKEKIIEYRRDFHKYPEVGWSEFRTTSLIARRLIELGYDVKLGHEIINDEFRRGVPCDCVLKENYAQALKENADKKILPLLEDGFTGVVGILKNGDGPVVALRFDIDALKIQESEDEEHLPVKEGFCSVHKNIMHACGHDGHAAIGLGVAEVLMNIKQHIKGTIKLIFQPAEEGVKGAKPMIENGVVDDVDYFISGHIGLKADKSGEIICGVSGFLANSQIDAIFTGRASHAGAAPEKGQNALLAATTATLNLYAISRHSQGATRINVGTLEAGTQRNIIPQSAHMKLETRGETSEINEYMRDYAQRILKAAAEMHDTKIEITYEGGSISAQSDDEMIQKTKETAKKIEEYSLIYDKKINFGASEDVAYMMDKVQSNGGKAVYILFGSNLKSEHHNPMFDFNEKDLIPAVKTYSILVYDILK